MATLIAYASKYGSTEKCAAQLAEKLGGKVELLNLKKSQKADLSQFDKIIIGSSVYMGSIQKEVKAFCEEHKEALKAKPTGLYLCALSSGDDAEKQLSACYPQDLLEKAAVRDTFGGELKFRQMNVLEKLAIHMVRRSEVKKKGSSLISDLKTDVSTISEERLDRFVQALKAV